MGRGGGQVVSLPGFNSEDPSSSPAEAYSFFCKICAVYSYLNGFKNWILNLDIEIGFWILNLDL